MSQLNQDNITVFENSITSKFRIKKNNDFYEVTLTSRSSEDDNTEIAVDRVGEPANRDENRDSRTLLDKFVGAREKFLKADLNQFLQKY